MSRSSFRSIARLSTHSSALRATSLSRLSTSAYLYSRSTSSGSLSMASTAVTSSPSRGYMTTASSSLRSFSGSSSFHRSRPSFPPPAYDELPVYTSSAIMGEMGLSGGGAGIKRFKSCSGVISKRAYSVVQETQEDDQGKGRFIRIVEVSPRDGLQNLPPPAIPTATKRELITRLLDCGVRNIEVGSFVRGDWVPQMADSAALLPTLPMPSSIPPPPTRPTRSSSPLSGIPIASKTIPIPAEDQVAHYPVLVPNMRGLDNLLKLEEEHKARGGKEKLTDEIAVFVSATEGFSQANNHAPIAKVIGALPAVVEKAHAHGYRVRGYVSCVMTCPYSGATTPQEVISVAEKLLAMGCYEVSLGDTTGEGNPEAWKVLWEELERSGMDMSKVAAHCHDTFSMALTSIIALLPYGLRTIDSSLAGLGGCPYSPGATGNVPTEDVVYALHKLGYETGIDLDKLVETGIWLSETLGVRNESRVGKAIWGRKKAREAKEAKEANGQ